MGKAAGCEPKSVLRGPRPHVAQFAAVVFLIGGPDGLAADLIGRADMRLGFGPATWPHQLVRIMLLEQVYRAMTILSGHPYHRE